MGLARLATIRSAVDQLVTDPSYRQAAAELRQDMRRQPSPAAVVPELERLASAINHPAQETEIRR